MDKKKAGIVTALVASGVILGGATFGPLGLVNNEQIKKEYNDAADKPIVTRADEETLQRLKARKTVSDISSYLSVFGLTAATGAGMGAMAALLNTGKDEEEVEEANEM